MDQQLKRIFYDELARQCDFVIMGHDQLIQIIQRRQEGIIEKAKSGILDLDSDRTFEHSSEMNAIFFIIQGILVSCANISKILWPSLPRNKELTEDVDERAALLKSELGITEPHALQSRDMRDAYEHFDERLHSWFLESDQNNFVDTSIGPIGAVGGIATKDIMRWYDSTRDWLVFRGRVYKLTEVVDAIKLVRAQIK